MSCPKLGICKTCINIRGRAEDDPINLRYIFLYTDIPELWNIFKSIIAISPMTEVGFSMLGANAYLEHYPKVLQVTHGEFWKTMAYFLGRMNARFNERRKLKALEAKGR